MAGPASNSRASPATIGAVGLAWRQRSRASAVVAGCAALALAAGAGAHEPLHDDGAALPPPGIETTPGVPIDGHSLGKQLTRARAAIAPPRQPTLRELAADSTAIVEGRITRSERLDDGHLWRHRLEVTRTLRGAVDGAVLSLVEQGAPSDHGLLLSDAPVVVFLRPAPDHPALAGEPPDSRFAPTGGRSGLVAIADDAARAAVDRALADGAVVRSLADADAARAAKRTMAFRELASGVPRLATDAVLELGQVDPLRDLTDAEVGALRAALASEAVPAPSRVALLGLLADRHAADALPAVVEASTESPALLDARFRTRAALGAPAGRAELAPHLASGDPAVRAAALRALAAALPDADVEEIARAARDDADLAVRVAAIDLLGGLGGPGALAALADGFVASDRTLRQAAGRAILTIGGPAASDTLLRLALHAEPPDARSYAALLLVTASGRDSDPVRRLLASGPSPEVRRVLEQAPPTAPGARR